MKRLAERVAIVTGAARGIGKATALTFAREGATVVVWDVDEKAGQAVAQALRQEGPASLFQKVDTSDLGACEAAASEVVRQFGRIDILINNAGITRDATLKKMTPEQWQQVIDVNLTGVFNCTKAVYPHMAEREYGRIVTASSVVGLYGNFGQTNYAATKAGVIAMSKVWAREFGRKNITVNAVAPGFINTEMMATIPQKVLDMFAEKTPLGRLGEPAEVAKVYLFLASEEASFVTGAVLSVDGGITL
ncbi:MAG: 3-oxoacyl-ACP reductase FabG [Saprospiraceae bacterium]|nr:3-oxoacyl-ACP reductase FabG [Saprospiraceae bacterium]MCB0678001.1 3-oxoacyl-ACP reductase FabG [Saprospiraceae bacterium]MCB0683701.1 3-oxoacyl-ACP reductase FabG [Saprospiraceae bacterium]